MTLGPFIVRSVQGQRILCVPIGDTEVGNVGPPGGSPELVERFGRVIEAVRHRIDDEADGHLGRLVLARTGDLIEGAPSQGVKLRWTWT